MVTFKYLDTYYTAFGSKECGNPHPKGYPCLFCLNSEKLADNQALVIKNYLKYHNLDYHEVIHYADKDINTHDLVNAIIKFHSMKRL